MQCAITLIGSVSSWATGGKVAPYCLRSIIAPVTKVFSLAFPP